VEGVGRVLREHRRRAGLTQQQVAQRAGLSLRALRDIEQGRVRRPRSVTVQRLAAVVGAADAGPPWVGVLGPLQVRRGAAEVAVTSPMQRRLLGLLALHAGRTVPTTEVVDALWGDQPPKNCLKLVHGHVARLRRVLPVLRQGNGYRLDLDTDLSRFDQLVSEARASSDLRTLAGSPSDRLHGMGLWAEALDCWRGPVLADVDGLGDRPAAVAAGQRRIDAALAYADLAVESGQYGAAVERLRGLAHDHPLHEAVHARFMLALAGAGQQAAALSAYAGIRDRLGYELGVEPGAELRAAHLRVLRQEVPQPAPPAMPVPAQLPADVSTFTGRERYLRQLDALLTGARAVVISAIGGTAGIGKTTLAVHWGHRVRSRFPDGQLYVNLRGFGREARPVPSQEALRGFLDALGVPSHRIPADLQAQTGLYRSLVADRRMLILLDNARDADQVRPLLPGSAGCLVVVTSRNQLPGLVAAEGAHPMTLDVLTPAEARRLLARRLRAERVAREPSALNDIAESCAYLPLALSIVAARAATSPDRSLGSLAAELRDARSCLDALAVGDAATDVRAVLSWSYASLSDRAARLFRLLGVHTGPDVGVSAAASLCGEPPDRVRPLLDELTRAHLVDEHVPGRYAYHDLLRAYTMELVETSDERTPALRRVHDHYLHTAYAADRLVDPYRPAIALAPPQPGVTVDRLADHEQALEWFAAEEPVLLGMVRQTESAQLAWTLTDYLDRQGHWSELAAVQQTALAAAERAGDHCGRAHAHRDLAAAYTRLGRFDDARAHLAEAFDLFAAEGDFVGQAYTDLTLCWVFDRLGDHQSSLDTSRRALELYRRGGDRAGEARTLNGIGWDYTQLGDHRRALDYCEQALAVQQEIGDRDGQPYTWDSLGFAHHHLGDHDQAVACYQRALEEYREFGNRYGEADTLVNLGDTRHAAGDVAAAREAWQRALDIRVELSYKDTSDLRAKLQMRAEEGQVRG
jgi:DNA-binding SARP family transcriptional activator/DNA-binding XRE family transcriptional regulator/Tfp pilus assembly protein PilF